MFASKVQIHRLQESLCIKDKLIDTYPKLYTFINKEPNKENAKFNVITLTGIEKMKENIDVLDFELTDDEMKLVASLDKETPVVGSSENPNLVEMSFNW